MIKDTQGQDLEQGSAIHQADHKRVPVVQLEVGVNVKAQVSFNVTAEWVDDVLF